MKVLQVSQFIFDQYVGKNFDEAAELSKTSMSFHAFDANEYDKIDKGTVWFVKDENGNCKLYGTNFDSSG